MKANKALKRLAKIDALMTRLAERVSDGSLRIREALEDAKAALARVRTAVSSQASSGKMKAPKAHSKQAAGKQVIQKGVRGRVAQKREATANTGQSKRKTAPARKKAAITARKSAPIKKARTTSTGPKKPEQAPAAIPAPVEAPPEPVAEMSAGE